MDNKKRLWIQGLAALIQNADFRGFFTGHISQSATKAFCVPGLNCYSCPGAVGACPIGSLQNSLSGLSFRFPYYVLGLMIFFGAVLGRAVCGFLCPFGLLQDLLSKIPFPGKIRTFRGDRTLRKLKYVVLVVLVVLVPIFAKLTPAFCKYLCPSGTLSGLLLALADSRLFAVLGGTFLWKVSVLVLVVILAIIIHRPFCKYLCPLGAFYAPFNRFALVRMRCDRSACVDCGACGDICGMGVDPSEDPNSAECIRCGACIRTCPVKALSYEFGLKERRPGKENSALQ